MTISCVNNTVIGRLYVKQRVRTYQQLIIQCNAPGKYPTKSLRHAANATAPVVCLVLCEVLLCGAVGEQRAALSCAESNIDMGANSWNLSCIPRCVKEQTRARNVGDGKLHSIRTSVSVHNTKQADTTSGCARGRGERQLWPLWVIGEGGTSRARGRSE